MVPSLTVSCSHSTPACIPVTPRTTTGIRNSPRRSARKVSPGDWTPSTRFLRSWRHSPCVSPRRRLTWTVTWCPAYTASARRPPPVQPARVVRTGRRRHLTYTTGISAAVALSPWDSKLNTTPHFPTRQYQHDSRHYQRVNTPQWAGPVCYEPDILFHSIYYWQFNCFHNMFKCDNISHLALTDYIVMWCISAQQYKSGVPLQLIVDIMLNVYVFM